MSSTSSEDELESDDENGTKSQLGRSNNAYKASRVFYRNRQFLQETSASVINSDSEIGHDRQEDVRPTAQSRTADHLTNNKQARGRNYKNSEHLNFNKSANFKSDSVANGKSADAVDRTDNYYKHNSQERRHISTETTKQQRSGNAINSGYNDNDKSKQRNDAEQKDPSLKTGRRENDSTDKERESSIHADNVRYSRNRRYPRKWQLLPIPPPSYSRPSVPRPSDDLRPYRRNLPPRLLAKLKQTTGSSVSVAAAAADESVAVTSCDDSKDSNVEDTHTKADVGNDDDATAQTEGELSAVCHLYV